MKEGRFYEFFKEEIKSINEQVKLLREFEGINSFIESYKNLLIKKKEKLNKIK